MAVKTISVSSHHFVTNQQSTALYIAGQNLDQALLEQLLEWNPWIIAHHEALDWLNSLSIKIDCLLEAIDGNVPVLPYDHQTWQAGKFWMEIRQLLESRQTESLTIAGPQTIDWPVLLEEWKRSGFPPLAIYRGQVKYFPIRKGAAFRKWVAADYIFNLDDAGHAEVSGDVEMEQDLFRVQSPGWIAIRALNDVIFGEYQ
jgi:hypothetical protein